MLLNVNVCSLSSKCLSSNEPEQLQSLCLVLETSPISSQCPVTCEVFLLFSTCFLLLPVNHGLIPPLQTLTGALWSFRACVELTDSFIVKLFQTVHWCVCVSWHVDSDTLTLMLWTMWRQEYMNVQNVDEPDGRCCRTSALWLIQSKEFEALICLVYFQQQCVFPLWAFLNLMNKYFFYTVMHHLELVAGLMSASAFCSERPWLDDDCGWRGATVQVSAPCPCQPGPAVTRAALPGDAVDEREMW